jgi:hypothetical protein
MRRPGSLAAMMCAATAIQAHAAPTMLTDEAACRLLFDERAHVGETITFTGDYSSDQIERAVVSPKGCAKGFGVGAIAEDAQKAMDPRTAPGLYPARDIEAVITGVLVQVKPSGGQFFHDQGVRLNITSVSQVKPLKPPAP